MHLDDAVTLINEAIVWGDKVALCNDMTQEQQDRITSFLGYALLAKDKIAEAKIALDAGLLDDARTALEQPVKDQTGQSASRYMRGMNNHGAKVIPGGCDSHRTQMFVMLDRTGKAWDALHRAIWHVQDARNEEIYFDPIAICSGPNNHCE